MNKDTKNKIANGGWEGIKFNVVEVKMEWLRGSFIGRLHSLDHLDSINDNLVLDGMSILRARYIGDNMVLFTGKKE